MGATEDWLASMRDKSAAKVGTALSYDKRNPDTLAEDETIGRELGVPSLAVSASPDVFRRQRDQKRMTDLLKDAPLTAKWLSERNNGALAKDDVETLTWFERTKQATDLTAKALTESNAPGRAIARGAARTTAIGDRGTSAAMAQRLGDFGRTEDQIYQDIVKGYAGNVPPAIEMTARQMAQVRAQAASGMSEADRLAALKEGSEALASARQKLDRAASFKMSASAEGFKAGALAEADNSFMGTMAAFAKDPIGGAAFVAETAAEFLPAMALATGVTVATRSPAAGAVTLGTASGLTENTNSAMEYLAEKGADVSTPEAAMKALENKELMEEAARRGITRGLIIGIMDGLSGGVAGQTLAKSPVGDVIAQGLAQVFFGAGGEAGAQLASGQEFDWKDVVIEGLAELVTAPIEVMGVGGRGLFRKLAKGDRSDVADRLKMADEAAANSKLKARMPDLFAEVLESQQLGDVYVPADGLREFFQAKDLSADEFGIDAEMLDERAMSGQHITIPVSLYASKMSGTDAAAWVQKNAVSSPDEISAAEAEDFNAQVQEILAQARQEAEDAIATERELQAADVQIYDQVFRDLRAAGRSPDVAQNEARVVAAFWRTMGERYSEDALALAKQFALRIQGPQTDVRRRSDLDIKLNTLRNGAPKPVGQSLVEFIRTAGGIRDTGGDVASMDPPKGVIAETREQEQDRRSQPTLGGMPAEGKGIGLDEMARKAAEAGYFPGQGEDSNMLLAAIAEELAGRPLYVPGEGTDPDLAALQTDLDRRGIDLAASNDEIAAALEATDGQTLSQVTPEQAREIDMAVEMPSEPLFAEAVENTPGARITDEGLLVDLVRFQKPEQAGVTSVRTGVFYLPLGSANVKHYKKGGKPGQWYGGPSAVQGQTLIKRPLFVKGATGGKAPEAAYDVIKGKGSAAKLNSAARAAALSPRHMREEVVYAFLEEHGADPNMAWEIIQNSQLGNQLTYALQENVVAHAARAAGHDAVIGYSKGKAGPFISEVFDVREVDYPIDGEQAVLHPDFQRTLYQSGKLNTDTEAFRKWFGDSKVVDDEGKPLVVYHGTDSEFEAFDPDFAVGDRRYTVFENNESKQVRISPFFFSNNKGYAQGMGRSRPPGEYYLSLQNPLVLDILQEGIRVAESIGEPAPETIEDAEDLLGGNYELLLESLANEIGNHDGVIFTGTKDGFHTITNQYVAFRPEQIKSVNNRGTFDPADPRILYQPAYHGSPHTFDRFSLDHMGTGEGAQAFGWGMYFAGRKGVAQYYRDVLSKGGVRDRNGNTSRSYGFMALNENVFDYIVGVGAGKTNRQIDAAAAQFEADFAEDGGEAFQADFASALLEGSIEDLLNSADPMAAKWTGVAKNNMTALGWTFSDAKTGRLYTVDIPEDSELLDWDKQLGEQVNKATYNLERALRKEAKTADNKVAWGNLLDDYEDGGITTAKFYDKLGSALAGSDAAARRDRLASEWLRAAGIPGHRFLDQGSRNHPYRVDYGQDGNYSDHNSYAEAKAELDEIKAQFPNAKIIDNGTYNYVIYDDARISVLEFEQQNRGSIVFPTKGLQSGETVINLFEGADLSTFLHEAGHYFLEAFTALASDPNAPQQMRDDMAAIREWLNVERSPDGTLPAFTTDQHEQWARGVEAYAMEGKAPSLALADAFARFKAWLTRIYRSIAGLNVNITPEIREVMDRMLATDAEIAEARAETAMSPLFKDAPAGMAPGDFQAYQRLARRSTEVAEQTLLEKTMAKVRREKEAWYRAEKKAVRKEVETAINKQPVYRLTEALANGRWIGSDKDIPDMRIDRAQLTDMFGEGVLKELDRTRLGGKRAVYTDGGKRPEFVAEFFGFSNVGQMVEALQNAGKRLDAIAAETERVMTERHGDPLNDGSIEAEALAAIHNDQQAQVVAAEARHIAKQLGRPTGNLNARIFRQRAKAMLGRMAAGEAAKPHVFLAAERKAAKTAEQAFAKIVKGKGEGALAEAYQAKEQQLLNHMLYMESRGFAAELERGREKMRAYDKASVREKLAGGYIEQIDALLDRFDFRKRSAGQINRAEKLAQYVQRMKDEGREAQLAIDERLLDEARKTHYSRMSVDELRGLFDTVANIDHMGRFKQKLIDAKEKRDLDELAATFAGALNTNVAGNPPSRTETAGERRKKLGRDYLNTVLTAETLLREIDGWKDMGPVRTAMKAAIDEGQNRLVERQIAMAKALDAIYGRYTPKEQRAMAKKVHVPELGGEFSKWEILTIALNTGNEGNYERLTNPKGTGTFKPATVEAVLGALDARDWETVQAIWDYVGSFWPEIAAKEKRQSGTEPPRVEAKLMTKMAPGVVRGGYYPIAYDSRLAGLTADFQQKDLADELMGGRFGKAQTRDGHTKARATTTKQAVKLDLSVLHGHLDQVTRDLELGEAVANAWRLLHHNDVREAFIQNGKQSDFKSLEIWLQDVAAGDRVQAGGIQSLMRHVRAGFTVSRLALNLSTALIQPTGLAQSAVVVGKKVIAKGTIKYLSNPARWVSEVTAVSSFMRERQKTFERDVYNVVGDLEGGPVSGRWDKFMRDYGIPMSFLMMQTTQFYAVDMPTWVGAYEKELALSGSEDKAQAYADNMVKRSQGSGLMPDRGMLERGSLNAQSRQQEFPRMLTALGSYMFAKGNVAYEQVMKTDFKDPVQVMSLAGDIALLFAFETLLYSAVKGYLPDDDEDEAGWLAWLAKETGLSMMSTLPLFRELAGATEGFSGGGIFGSAVEVLAKPIVQAAQGEFDKPALKAVVDAGGVLMHLPSSQAKAVIDGFFEQDMSLRSDPDPLRALGLGGGKGQSLADIVFGD